MTKEYVCGDCVFFEDPDCYEHEDATEDFSYQTSCDSPACNQFRMYGKYDSNNN